MKKRLLSAFILIAYSAILVRVLVFKDMPLIRIGPLMLNFGGTHEGPANLVPFKTILPYLLGENGLMIAAINIGGNIVLLVPIGFLVPFVFWNISWKKMLAIAAVSGLIIEGMQLVLRVGIFDIDDVILNAVGVMIGYWAFAILARWLRSKKYKTIIITVVIIIATAALVLYAIYPKGRQPVISMPDAEKGQPNPVDTAENNISRGADPCNGTGGTGQIVSVGNKSITIKRGDGVNQIIKLTDQTKISSSGGQISETDLKPGDRVTVVIDNSETAAVVLVCETEDSKSVK